jgi:hypothetical protein
MQDEPFVKDSMPNKVDIDIKSALLVVKVKAKK